MRKSLFIVLILFCQLSFAEDIYVVGGTIHVGNGEVIEKGVLVIKDGYISEVGKETEISVDTTNATVIYAEGKDIYPGIIAPDTRIGLVEIDYLRPTKDFSEVGNFNPNVRSLIAYNTDSEVGKTILTNGITHAQVVPSGGFISGSSSVVKMSAWNWEDATVSTDEGVHLRWPNQFRRTGWWASPGVYKEDDNYASKIEAIENFLLEAKAYAATKSPTTNLKFEAMRGVFNGEQNLYVHANGVKELLAAINLIDKLEIKRPVLVGANHVEDIIDLVKAKDIPVIVRSVHKTPSYRQSDVDESFTLPAKLQAAGIKFCLSYKGAWEQRNLPFLAGTAAAFGLTKEEALSAITKNTAEILGLEELGTLEKGKEGTFIISKGDVLDMRTSVIETMYIKGQHIELMDKQKALYNKFKTKYMQEGKL